MSQLQPFLTVDAWITLATLTALEIVLGIDNIVFLSITTEKLPKHQQPFARRVGLALALGMRLALLLAISWVMGLTAPLFTLVRVFSGRDLILLGGGLFLLAKATLEIFDRLEVSGAPEGSAKPAGAGASLGYILVQVTLLDVVFSLDSVVTAVGIGKHVSVMATAMIISVGVMLVFANAIAGFITRHPSLRMLALSFLMLIGVLLVADGMGQHISKGYVYFAMAFSLFVELINIRVRERQSPVRLHSHVGEVSGELL